MFGQKKLLVRVSEAARLLSVSQACVKRLMGSGALPTVRIEGAERVPLAALEVLAASTSEGGNSTTVQVPVVPLAVAVEPCSVASATVPTVPKLPRQRRKSTPPSPKESAVDPITAAAVTTQTPTAPAVATSPNPGAESDFGVGGLPVIPLPPSISPKGSEERSVACLMREWLRTAEGRVRPRTHASYAQMTRLHIVPELGSLALTAVDIRTVEEFFRDKRESGLSPRTVLYLRAILRQAFQDALRWDWISRNVIPLTRGPKQERSLVEVLSVEESRRLLASFRLPRHGLLFMTTLGLGLRFGEVLGLRWKDVTLAEDGKSGQVTVRVQLQKVNKEFALVPPKSRSGVRTLALPAFVARALAQRRNIEAEERLVAGHTWEGGDWGLVFSNQWGCPLDESRIRQRFREHLVQHGFPPMRFHDLRHQCASLLISQGTSPRAVMAILGHSQISLTMDTYSHVMPCVHQAAAMALDEIFYPPRTKVVQDF